jgi:hypothetical protein
LFQLACKVKRINKIDNKLRILSSNDLAFKDLSFRPLSFGDFESILVVQARGQCKAAIILSF